MITYLLEEKIFICDITKVKGNLFAAQQNKFMGCKSLQVVINVLRSRKK